MSLFYNMQNSYYNRSCTLFQDPQLDVCRVAFISQVPTSNIRCRKLKITVCVGANGITFIKIALRWDTHTHAHVRSVVLL
jgi:hypothetical protein